MALCPLIAPSYSTLSAELTGKAHRPVSQVPNQAFECLRSLLELIYNGNKMNELEFTFTGNRISKSQILKCGCKIYFAHLILISSPQKPPFLLNSFVRSIQKYLSNYLNFSLNIADGSCLLFAAITCRI